ncbi:ribonuclease HII [Sphaerothrix gracilis]|uniref:ribonuclease HII n=1 Tax=Sphaerothrix gracilis TaxID=3151835 RepID=UPI0031FD145D
MASCGGDGGGGLQPKQLPLRLTDLSETKPQLTSEQIAGVDEVGRGALFGPVVAAAVILTAASIEPLVAAGVQDSKQLTPQRRSRLYQVILAAAVDCRIGISSAYEIDRVNILQATFLAMRRAILSLSPAPQLCLIDGNRAIPNLPIYQETWIKGDQRSVAIAAASIIAKVWRDRLIVRLAQRYPHYDLASNKGYGSAKHRAALLRLGPTRQHRKSFKPCQDGNIASKAVNRQLLN